MGWAACAPRSAGRSEPTSTAVFSLASLHRSMRVFHPIVLSQLLLMRAGQSQTPECRGVRAKLVGCRWIGGRATVCQYRGGRSLDTLSGGRNFSMLYYCWLMGWVSGLGLDHIHRPRGGRGQHQTRRQSADHRWRLSSPKSTFFRCRPSHIVVR